MATVKISNNKKLKGALLESGFGGEGGSNTSAPSAEKIVRIMVDKGEEQPGTCFYPYRFGDYYGNFTSDRIVVKALCDDRVYLEINGKEVVLDEEKDFVYSRLRGISYDTYAYYKVTALY